LARLLSVTIEQIQEILWKARYEIGARQSNATGFTPPLTQSTKFSSVKAASLENLEDHRCPEYHPLRPWAQKYLDHDEASGRERFFLQNHLLACPSCQICYQQCRAIFYNAQKATHQAVGSANYTASLKKLMLRSIAQIHPTRLSIRESLSVFLTRAEGSWMAFGLVGWFGFLVFKWVRNS
jgi:hypothetical protein